MKKLLPLLLALLMMCGAAFAEETPAFAPIPWDVDVSPNLPDKSIYGEKDMSYHDASIDIDIEMIRDYDTDIMVMHVKLTDISQFRTALAGKYPSKNATPVKSMAKKVNAVAAVSGDYFNYHDEGVVVRNGKLLRDRFTAENQGGRRGRMRDLLIIDKAGDFHIVAAPSDEVWRAWDHDAALHVFSYGPGLVIDGEPLLDMDSVHLSCGKNKKTQRLVLGQVGALEYIIIATEGPENPGSKGLTIPETVQLCMDMGIPNAYNLDGGSSSTIVMNNHKINALSSHKERPIGDCIWFATLVPSK